MYRSVTFLSVLAAGLVLVVAGCATPAGSQHDHGTQPTSKNADCKKMAQMHARHHGASAPAGAASAASMSCAMMTKG